MDIIEPYLKIFRTKVDEILKRNCIFAFDSKKEMNKQILENIHRLKRQLLPNDRMILFGSHARGDARADSDWDLLLLLDKPRKEQSDQDKAYEFVLMGWEYGTYLSIKIYTQEQWEKGKMFPFYKNVINEGIEIK